MLRPNRRFFLNADDVGISNGVNRAVISAITNGALRSISVMTNLTHSIDAINIAQTHPEIKTGLHLNIMIGHSINDAEDVPYLTDTFGKFRGGFIRLFLLSIFHKKELQSQIEIETIAQLDKLRDKGIVVNHIDSHRHIHMIPAIFSVMKKIAEENNIPRIRFINESFLNTFSHNSSMSYLYNGGLIKFMLLKFLSLFIDYPTKTYFYSVLFTGKISKARVRGLRIPSKYTEAEIMIHPNMIEVDKNTGVIDKNVLSRNRKMEYETAMDKSLINV